MTKGGDIPAISAGSSLVARCCREAAVLISNKRPEEEEEPENQCSNQIKHVSLWWIWIAVTIEKALPNDQQPAPQRRKEKCDAKGCGPSWWNCRCFPLTNEALAVVNPSAGYGSQDAKLTGMQVKVEEPEHRVRKWIDRVGGTFLPLKVRHRQCLVGKQGQLIGTLRGIGRFPERSGLGISEQDKPTSKSSTRVGHSVFQWGHTVWSTRV